MFGIVPVMDCRWIEPGRQHSIRLLPGCSPAKRSLKNAWTARIRLEPAEYHADLHRVGWGAMERFNSDEKGCSATAQATRQTAKKGLV
jgi:hypothetical protein